MITILIKFLRKRFVGFSLVGLGVMIGGLVLLYVLVKFCRIDQNIAYLIQAFASIESSFVLNRWLNWKDRNSNIWMQLIKFNLTRLGIVVFNQLIFVLMVSWGIYYMWVAIFGAILATIINYFINDWFVFTARKPGQLKLLSSQPSTGEEFSLSQHERNNYGYQERSPLAGGGKRPV